MSKSYSTLISNKTNTAFSFQNKPVKNKKNINDLAIEECKKLYSKNCAKPNPYVLNQMKKDKLNIYLNNLKSKDLTIINRILAKFFYFKHIELSPFDPEKEDCSKKRKNRLKEIPTTEKEFLKLKPKNALEKEKNQNIFKILMGISRYLSLSENVISLSLNSVMISKDSAKYLAQGLLDNKTLQGLNINYCIISLDAYELFMKSLLKHEIIEYLDLSNNNFNDKYGEMIALIISHQTQRRDQIIWASGLRNEFPSINEYSRGLVSINLRGNKFGKYSADCISKSLSHDQYIRIIDLSENNLDNNSCKKFIHMMRKNNILLTVDLRENPGYDESIYQRMIMKMSKNIRYLYQQFQNGNYTEEEFENLKDFIDISFFDVDIPQEIVDYYNGNIQDTLEGTGEENQMQNNKLQLENMNVMNDIQERAEEEEDEGTIKTIQEQAEINNQKTEEENKKLLEENNQLKQQILELKTQKTELENKNKNKTNNKVITKPDDPNNIEENYGYIIDLINELNEVMNNIENIKKKKEKNIKPNNKKIENLEKNKEDNYINNQEYNEEENNIINNNTNINNQNENENENGNYQKYPGANDHQIQNQQQINEEENEQEYDPHEQEYEQEQEHEQEIEQEQEEHEQNHSHELQNHENLENEDIKDNNIQIQDQEHETENNNEEENNNNFNNNNGDEEEEIQNKNGEENMEVEGEGEGEGEEGMEEGENEDEEINLDDLTEEEKLALFQQQEILQKLQEEAEARGEHFDVQEYLAMLEKQANEEEEEEGDNKGSDKVNKSF